MSLLGTFAKRKGFYNNDGMVNIIMNTNRIVSIEDIEEFLKGTNGPTEIALLIEADKALNFPNGHALKINLVREYSVFKNEKYSVISQISVSHIYNIRNNSLQYQSATMHYTKTNPVVSNN